MWEKWDKVLKVILGLLVTAALLTDRHRIHALVWLMVIALGYFGVKGGLFTLVTGGGYIVAGPPNSIIADRNQLAVALLVALPLMNYLRLHSAHRVVRIGLIIGMALMLFSIVGTQSRGALVGLAATAFVLWLRSRGEFSLASRSPSGSLARSASCRRAGSSGWRRSGAISRIAPRWAASRSGWLPSPSPRNVR